MQQDIDLTNAHVSGQKETMRAASLKEYVAIARLDHWFKNVFMLPGMVFAFLVYDVSPDLTLLAKIILGVASTCFIASANYVINEFLDAEFDRYHPEKKKRSAVMTELRPSYVYIEYALFAVAGLGMAYWISLHFFALEAFLLFMGFLYNVRPFRTKERAFLDVLSESINNPIRFALGWFIFVPAALLPENLLDPSWLILPPSSILLAYLDGRGVPDGYKKICRVSLHQ